MVLTMGNINGWNLTPEGFPIQDKTMAGYIPQNTYSITILLIENPSGVKSNDLSYSSE
jgi:hypothetical protein